MDNRLSSAKPPHEAPPSCESSMEFKSKYKTRKYVGASPQFVYSYLINEQ